MKRKNIVKGEFIVAKNKHGGAGLGAVLTKGQGYRVIVVEDEPYYGDMFCAIELEDGDLSCAIELEDKVFWVDPQHFRKQK